MSPRRTCRAAFRPKPCVSPDIKNRRCDVVLARDSTDGPISTRCLHDESSRAGGGDGARDRKPATVEMLKPLRSNYITAKTTMSIPKRPDWHKFLTKIGNLCRKAYFSIKHLVEMLGCNLDGTFCLLSQGVLSSLGHFSSSRYFVL